MGDDGNGNQIGVAPGAKWIACRNMDSGGNGKPAWYTECFQFMIAPWPIGGDPSQGDPTKAPGFHQQFLDMPAQRRLLDGHAAQHRGCGARGRNCSPRWPPATTVRNCSTIQDPPAIYASSFDVGAPDSGNQIASFSSRGPVIADGSNRTKPDRFGSRREHSRRGAG